MSFASYVHRYYNTGYLVYQEGGESGKVCADHLNRSVPEPEMERVLNKMGESMCDILDYQTLMHIDVRVDTEENNDIRYVDMVGPMSDKSRSNRRSFVSVPCVSREVVHIECSDIRCGKTPARLPSTAHTDFLERSGDFAPGLHGDWPWHVALVKNGQHVCDGTLVHENWIMTTAACFQGYVHHVWMLFKGHFKMFYVAAKAKPSGRQGSLPPA